MSPLLKKDEMSLSQDRKNHIDIAVAAGREPRVGRSGQTTLNLRQNPGRSSYTVLGRADGSLTPAGSHYYKMTGGPAPSRQFDRGTPLVKKGAGDSLGKQFFRGGKTEYVVSIPAIVSGQNAKGRIQNRRTMCS